ncbi:LuxR C-terminal-related transcriptional regulator [Cellulomonas cellasea]|uniref:helix-turn-helix transcriptional regulator n=1 Tax=Cellulomonas cellasea TaxID=43670 RepID=UPI0025A4A56A|nr:LuxR C-terminal-related transcriptional regulator [Cellulomonas cellasea]MDM8085401.1 LuxR C-terminal-related transcriptional regulator [Cellulomonas cellasea]
MSIEPLRRTSTVVRGAPPVARRSPVAAPEQPQGRRGFGQMCVVVTDLADGDGQILVRNVRRRGSGRVILLARRAARRELVGLLSGGLRGAVAGEAHPSVPQPAPVVVAPVRADLTARELGVLALVADGCSNRRIGEHLGLSALTVKSHLARISRKLGTGDRAALVALAIRSGLIP